MRESALEGAERWTKGWDVLDRNFGYFDVVMIACHQRAMTSHPGKYFRLLYDAKRYESSQETLRLRL